MIFKCIELPEKEFATKDEMFLALKANETKIIGLKMAHVYKSCEKAQISFLNLDVAKLSETSKADFEIKSGYIYPVISTTNYMDSHKDVHFVNCFNKTIKDQQGKVYFALDHELKWNSILSWPKDVRMFKSMLDWALVGKSYDGQTEGLIFEISKDKITRKDVLDAIESKATEFELSIRMNYEKMRLGINSENKDLAENKAYYDSRYKEIANKEQVDKDGYFWGVEELRINKEGSLVVAGGSNDATRIIVEDNEAADSTSSKTEPQTSTQELTKFINPNIY